MRISVNIDLSWFQLRPVGYSKEVVNSMWRPTFFLFALFLLVDGSAMRAPAQSISSNSAKVDHISMFGPSCPPFPCPDGPVQDQIRFLIGHWPRDFEIAVVESTGRPKCREIANRTQCSLRVKPVELILGHRESVASGSGHSHTNWTESYEINYSFPSPNNVTLDAAFEVRQGDQLVALLTPAKQEPKKPLAYVAIRLDRANDDVVKSIQKMVGETLYQALGPVAVNEKQ